MKSERLILRCTSEERSLWTVAAEGAGVSLSEWMRAGLNGLVKVKVVHISEADAERMRVLLDSELVVLADPERVVPLDSPK